MEPIVCGRTFRIKYYFFSLFVCLFFYSWCVEWLLFFRSFLFIYLLIHITRESEIMAALDGHWDHKTTANQFVYFVFAAFHFQFCEIYYLFYTALWSGLGEGVRFCWEKKEFFFLSLSLGFIDRSNEANENCWDFFFEIRLFCISMVSWTLKLLEISSARTRRFCLLNYLFWSSWLKMPS